MFHIIDVCYSQSVGNEWREHIRRMVELRVICNNYRNQNKSNKKLNTHVNTGTTNTDTNTKVKSNTNTNPDIHTNSKATKATNVKRK